MLFQDSLHRSFSLQAIIAFALTHPAATRSAGCAIDLRPVCLSQFKPKTTKKGVQLKTLRFPLYTFYYLYLTEPLLCKHFLLL